MINAVVVSNAIVSLTDSFVSNDRVRYHFETIDERFDPDLTYTDLLIVPNGCDHIAMLKIKDNAHVSR